MRRTRTTIPGGTVDFSNFKISDWLMAGGGVAMLILGFVLPWSSVSFAGVSDSGDGPFDYFLTGGIAWILVVAVGILALLRALGKLPETQPWPLIFLAAAGVATLLMIIQVILGGRELVAGFDADRGIGMYLALVWAAIVEAGAFMSFQEAGGDIKDLTSVDKIKGSFSGNDSGSAAGDDTAPPPPPPPAD
jgi:hypothetical protein